MLDQTHDLSVSGLEKVDDFTVKRKLDLRHGISVKIENDQSVFTETLDLSHQIAKLLHRRVIKVIQFPFYLRRILIYNFVR